MSGDLKKENQTSSEEEDYTGYNEIVYKPGVGFDDIMPMYKAWAPTYERDMVVKHGYTGPEQILAAVKKLKIDKDARILDVGAGTGLNAKVLKRECGIHNIDALDASSHMLDEAKKANLYKQYYCCRIGEGHVIPIPDNVYDAAVIGGAMWNGHVQIDALDEMARVTKPGGYIINVWAKKDHELQREYKDMDQLVERKCQEGIWEYLHEDIVENFLEGLSGQTHIFRMK